MGTGVIRAPSWKFGKKRKERKGVTTTIRAQRLDSLLAAAAPVFLNLIINISISWVPDRYRLNSSCREGRRLVEIRRAHQKKSARIKTARDGDGGRLGCWLMLEQPEGR